MGFCDDLCFFIWSFLEVPIDVNNLNLNAQDKSGLSALLHATRRSHSQIVSLLLEMPGIDVNCRDESGWTPLMIASRKGQNVSLFLKNGEVDVNIQDEEG